jgi:hypothetical protein
MQPIKYIQGKDGYLFLDNDTNYAIRQISGEYVLHQRTIIEILASEIFRESFCSKLKSKYFHLIAPSKELVLREKLPDSIKYRQYGKTPVELYIEKYSGISGLNSLYFNPSCLRDGSDVIYYSKTDTHWTHKAAIRYFNEFILHKATGDFLLNESNICYKEKKVLGDLGRHAGLDSELLLTPEFKDTYEIVFESDLINTGYIRHTKSCASNQKKILVLHDSFTHWLYDYISLLYTEVLFIHTSGFDSYFVDRYKPDMVLFIQAERFLIAPSVNNLDYTSLLVEQEIKKNMGSVSSTYLKSLYQ